MKKFFLMLLALLLILFLSIFLFSKVYEDRLVQAFKNQFIDKTNLNVDFEEIHFSLLRYFPYGLFTLDNAKIFYSKHNRKDTLLNSKQLRLKINAINLFKRIYEFPEIIISDGSIRIKGEMLDTLFTGGDNTNQKNNYFFDFKSIKLVRCKIQYHQRKSIAMNAYTERSSLSGSFLSNSLAFKLNLNINRFSGHLNDFHFKTNDFIKVSSTIRSQNNSYFSENGKIFIGNIGLGFSFLYNIKNEQLQVTTNSEKVSAKAFFKQFLNQPTIHVSKGSLSFDSFYSINFNVANSQKLTLKYSLENIAIEDFKNLSIIKLEGKTSITNDFNKNNTEINSYLIHYNGFELSGSSKIRDFPKPAILIDSKIKSIGEMLLSDSLSLQGNLSGNIKVLVKVDDINKLYYKSLKISKIYTDLTLINISIKSIDYIRSLSGSLHINNDELEFNGKGILYNKKFKGMLVLPEFMNVAFHEAKPSPKILLEMDRLNLDSVLMTTSANSTFLINYQLKSKIKSLKYKGVEISDLDINYTCINNRYNCQHINFKAFKGSINGAFTYSNHDVNSLSITGQGIEIKNLFKSFNSFEQKTVTADNISGLVSGKVDMSYQILDNKFDPLSIKMVSNITIENGKLSGIKQLKRVSNFLNISEIDSFRFKTIHNKIDIENGMIRIPSMDIASNALNFQLSGQHGFNGEFTYWIKLYLKEILAKKYLSKKEYGSGYEMDSKNGLNLFLKIFGNNETFKVTFDKKSTLENIKSNFNQEGVLLKSIIKDEFKLTKKHVLTENDSLSLNGVKKIDSTHNKKPKKPFKIEWDEIDTTKINNQ
ncbi:MAG: hypothetical protein EHM93_09560 [Bacteroidales bacterium]|nr:MAG: hypothetical protein EHM93_09560 [Bacteroidales bacterium]